LDSLGWLFQEAPVIIAELGEKSRVVALLHWLPGWKIAKKPRWPGFFAITPLT